MYKGIYKRASRSLESPTFLITIESKQQPRFSENQLLELKPHKEKRSLKANAYCWTLINQIANKLNITSNEVYEQMLKDYGTNEIDENGDTVIISTKADLAKSEIFHLAFIGKGVVNGKMFNHYRLIKGSSQYNTQEMTIFIKGIVEEAQALDIDTRTPEEIENLLNLIKEQKK